VKSRRQKSLSKPPLDLIEEGFHLLRSSSASALTAYFIGTVPFVLAFLYFWSDMSRSAFAKDRLFIGALGLTILFVWMKAWHSVFAQELLKQVAGHPPPRWSLRWLIRLGADQAPFQALGLFLLPLAFMIALPFGWVFVFFQNITILGGQNRGSRDLAVRAWQQARLWPGENHALLGILWGLFAPIVALNLFFTLIGVPILLKWLLGIETAISQSPESALNSTLLAGVAGVTYLCVDPIVKAVYTLRVFYGESLRTGADLRADLYFSGTVSGVKAEMAEA
jgi:hypothetical protein